LAGSEAEAPQTTVLEKLSFPTSKLPQPVVWRRCRRCRLNRAGLVACVAAGQLPPQWGKQ